MARVFGSAVVVHSKVDELRAIKAGQLVFEFWVGEVEKNGRRFSVCGRVQEDGGVAIGVEAAGDRGATRALDAQALSPDGDALLWVDFGLGAQAPNVRPPRAVWNWA